MIGRARAVESAALVASSLAGGLLAGLLSTRATYFLSLPFTLLSILALLRFAEPTLHQTTERVSLRAQIRRHLPHGRRSRPTCCRWSCWPCSPR